MPDNMDDVRFERHLQIYAGRQVGAGSFGIGETEDYLLRIGPVGVDVPTSPPMGRTGLRLEPARPNPFQSSSMVAFTLDRAATVRVTVTDVSGREVACLIDGEQSAGRHEIRWSGRSGDGQTLPAGVYFLHAYSGATVVTQRVAILR